MLKEIMLNMNGPTTNFIWLLHRNKTGINLEVRKFDFDTYHVMVNCVMMSHSYVYLGPLLLTEIR